MASGSIVHEPDVLKPARGLTDHEAAARLLEDGFNELPSAQRRGLLSLVGEVLREPMLLLLVGVGVVYLLLGDPPEAAALVVALHLLAI